MTSTEVNEGRCLMKREREVLCLFFQLLFERCLSVCIASPFLHPSQCIRGFWFSRRRGVRHKTSRLLLVSTQPSLYYLRNGDVKSRCTARVDCNNTSALQWVIPTQQTQDAPSPQRETRATRLPHAPAIAVAFACQCCKLHWPSHRIHGRTEPSVGPASPANHGTT
jgi:hypothetical protein